MFGRRELLRAAPNKVVVYLRLGRVDRADRADLAGLCSCAQVFFQARNAKNWMRRQNGPQRAGKG